MGETWECVGKILGNFGHISKNYWGTRENVKKILKKLVENDKNVEESREDLGNYLIIVENFR